MPGIDLNPHRITELADLDITGFTEGSVLFAGASSVTEDNANLFYDDANNRFGVRTNTPREALEVAGNIFLGATNTLIFSETPGGKQDLMFSPAAGIMVQENLSVFRVFSDTNNNNSMTDSMFEVLEGDTYAGGGANTLMDILKNGNVGFGTVTPAEKLEIEDADATTILQISNAAVDGDPVLAFALSGTKNFTMGIDDGDGDDFKIGTTAIGTNTRLRIDGTSGTIQTYSDRMIQTETSTTTATMSDTVELHECNGTSAYTLTLPTHKAKKRITISNINTGLVTLSPTSGNISGASTQELDQYESLTLKSDGTDWELA